MIQALVLQWEEEAMVWDLVEAVALGLEVHLLLALGLLSHQWDQACQVCLLM